ncbi:hypothetical protein BGZ75_002414 [Mortierella antarctica]|nr:hypothetical protein BGZ75_002414 [Mortierella antarctica]
MVCPLDLPEMLLYIAPYLSNHTLVSAIQVSRQWHQSFSPFLYSSLMVHDNWSDSPSFPTLDVLQKHASSVRSLNLHTTHGLAPFLHRCTNLKILAIYKGVFSTSEPKDLWKLWIALTQLVQQNPMLEWILFGLERKTSPPTEFLQALVQACPNLRRFESSQGIYDTRGQAEALLQVMTRVEQVSARYEYFINIPMIDRWHFPKLWELTMKDITGLSTQSQVDLMCQCPNLKILKWTVSKESQFPVREFCERVPVACPKLSQFHTDGYSVPDPKDLSRIMASLPRLESLVLCANRITQTVFGSLTRHFATLETLDVVDCFGFRSWMIQQVLETCPNLVKLSSSHVSMKDIVHGKAWVATRLRFLELDLKPSSSRTTNEQAVAEHWATFQQLSKLTQLQTLATGTQGLTAKSGVRFQLDYGLAQLSTLTQLKELNMKRSYQRMTLKDVEWFGAHMKQLQRIEGIFDWEWEWHQDITSMFRSFGWEVPDQDHDVVSAIEMTGLDAEDEDDEEEEDDYDDEFDYYEEEEEDYMYTDVEGESMGPSGGDEGGGGGGSQDDDGLAYATQDPSAGAGPMHVVAEDAIEQH